MLIIYKGYEKEYLEKNLINALISNKVEEKIKISSIQKDVAKKVIAQFTANIEELKKFDKWITYEEFSVCYKTIVELAELYDVDLKVIENNKYYNVYHLEFYNEEEMKHLIETQNLESAEDDENTIYSYV